MRIGWRSRARVQLSGRQRLPGGIAVGRWIVRDLVGICAAGGANSPNVGVGGANGPLEGDLSTIGGVDRIKVKPRKSAGLSTARQDAKGSGGQAYQSARGLRRRVRVRRREHDGRRIPLSLARRLRSGQRAHEHLRASQGDSQVAYPSRARACQALEAEPGARAGALPRQARLGLSPAAVHKFHTVLHKALAQALQWNMVPRNVTDAVKAWRPTPKEMRPLSLGEARKLLEASRGDRLEALYVLAVHTGVRQGEFWPCSGRTSP